MYQVIILSSISWVANAARIDKLYTWPEFTQISLLHWMDKYKQFIHARHTNSQLWADTEVLETLYLCINFKVYIL